MRTKELLALGIFNSGSRLGDRIEVLLKSGRKFSARASLARVAITTLALLALVVGGSLAPRWIAFAQARPAFEVASVKPTPPDFFADRAAARPRDGFLPQQLNSGNLNYYGATMIEYIEAAYGLKDYQLSGPRPRNFYDRYDIAAKAAGPVSDQQMKLMLQTLLEDRFKLRVHRETKELPVYALIVGKNGPKFNPAADDGKSGVSGISATGIKWHNISMDYLAEWISGLPSLGRPVVDRTGLPGGFDFTLSVEGLPDTSDLVAIKTGLRDALDAGIFAAIQNLGLKLESDKAPIDLYTVEHVERPDAN